MKRLMAAIALMVATGVCAHALYARARPMPTEETRSLAWLARELSLTPAQQERVGGIHFQRCREIRRLGAEAMGCSPHEMGRMQGACRAATVALVEEVCAQLEPEQRTRYLHLVAPCLAAPMLEPR